MRLGGPAHGIVTKTVHKTLPGACGGPGVGGYRVTGDGGGPGGGVGEGRWGVCKDDNIKFVILATILMTIYCKKRTHLLEVHNLKDYALQVGNG